MKSSLRLRMLAGTSLAGILILSLLGLSVYLAMRHALIRDFDDSLRIEAHLVAGMIDQDDARITFEFDPQQMPDFLSDSRHRFFEIWRSDGSVLARSPSLGNRDLMHGSIAQKTTEIELPNSHHGRAFTLPFKVFQQEQEDSKPRAAPQTVTILVAAEPVEVHRMLGLLAWLLMVLCSIAVIVMGVVLLRVVGQGLRPVTRLAGEIGSLRETDLSRRLSMAAVPTELAPIVEKLNGLLIRLDQAFAREKAFTADVSHELRTPLAGLRSTLEVCRSRPRDSAAYESALDDCLGITDRMEAMVQSLLLLARSDAGQVPIERRSVDLGQIVTESWALFQSRADRRGVTVVLELPSHCLAATDPEKLRIVLSNLLDNAVSYVDDGGRLRIGIHQNVVAATIEIANSGSQIAAEDASQLFDRFQRGDTARTDAGHCGLGLSISRRLITLLGGEIHIESAKGGEFLVCLKLPVTGPSAPEDSAI